MKAEKKSKVNVQKKTKTKKLKLISAFVVIVIVLAFFLTPAFVSSEKGRRIILAKINKVLAGQTDFASLSMSWFTGIKVTDFRFSDSAGQTSVRVKQITTRPHYGSILTGQLSFGQTTIDKPIIQINLKDQRITKPARQKISPEQKPTLLIPPLKQIDLVVNDGNLEVTDQQAKTIELSQINSQLNLRPPGQQTTFELNMAVLGKAPLSKIHAAGQLTTPKTKTGWTFKGTTGNLTVQVNDLDLQSLTPFFALAALDVQAKGTVSANINSQFQDGQVQNLTGTIKAKNLDLTAAKLKGDRLKTDTLDIDVNLSCRVGTININQLKLKSDWAVVNVTGVIPTTIKSFTEFIEPASPHPLKAHFEYDLPAVCSQMPRTLGLKPGMQITSGQLTGNIEKITQAGKQKIQGQATLCELQGTIDGKKVSLSQPIQAQTQISSDKTGIKFDQLNVSSSFAQFNCTGTTELLNYLATVDLKKWQAELGQFAELGPYKLAGQVSGKGQASIKEEKISTTGTFRVKNLTLASEEASASEPAAEIAFDFTVDQKNDVLALNSAKADAALGRASIKNALLPLAKKPTKPLRLPISVQNIDLQKLQPFLVLLACFPKQMQLAGTAKSDLLIRSEKDIYTIFTDSTKIKNLKLAYPGQKPFEPNEVSLILEAQINPQQKTINVKKLQLESPSIKIKKGQFKQTSKAGKIKLQGQFDCEYDWSAIRTIIAAYLPKDLQLQGKRKDTVNFTGEYPTSQTDKLLPNLNAKAKLGFEKADYMGPHFGPTEVNVQIQNGLLNIAPFSSTVNHGKFNFAAQANFQQKPMVLKMPRPIQIAQDIQINSQTTKKLLAYLNPIFANAVNVTGIANFHCERLAIPLTKADINDLQVIGTISVEKLHLQASDLLGQILSVIGSGTSGTDLTIHPTRFVLQKGFVRYDNMQIDVGDNPVNFKGTIGLDKSLDMTVTLPYTVKGTTTRTDRETADQRITLPLTGTLKKPQLELSKLLQEQLKKQLERQIRKGLEDLFK